jgi:hypothetical protein
MTIRVEPALRRSVRQQPGMVGIRITSTGREAAADALARLRRQLLDIGSHPRWGPVLEREGIPPISYVSGVSVGPSGPALWFDGRDAPGELLEWAADELVARLREVGVTDATVASPERSRLATSDQALLGIPNVVSLRLFPDPPVVRNGVPSPVPEAWLRLGFDWLRREVPRSGDVAVLDLLVDSQATLPEAEAFLERARVRRAIQALVLAGDAGEVVGTLGGYFAVSAALCLSLAGPALDSTGLVEGASRLRRLAAELAPEVSLAILTTGPWLGPVLGLFPPTTIAQEAGGAPPEAVYHHCDELLFDAYPSQVLGPGHLRRLGGAPPGSSPLAGGRAEYVAGDLRDWLPGSATREIALEAARAVLRPCLVPTPEAQELFLARWGRGRAQP